MIGLVMRSNLPGQSMERTTLPSIDEFVLPGPIKHIFTMKEKEEPILAPISLQRENIDAEKYQRSVRSWSTSEDEQLRTAVAKYNGTVIRWDVVAKEIPTRNMKQCRERWEFHLDPTIDRQPFTPMEDEIIVVQQRALGNRWTTIAELLPGRTSCAVKNRWYTVLKKLPVRIRDEIVLKKSATRWALRRYGILFVIYKAVIQENAKCYIMIEMV